MGPKHGHLKASVAAMAGGAGWLPEWQLLPGIRLVVDKFGPKTRSVPATAWFLTHFHADHYGGERAARIAFNLKLETFCDCWQSAPAASWRMFRYTRSSAAAAPHAQRCPEWRLNCALRYPVDAKLQFLCSPLVAGIWSAAPAPPECGHLLKVTG